MVAAIFGLVRAFNLNLQSDPLAPILGSIKADPKGAPQTARFPPAFQNTSPSDPPLPLGKYPMGPSVESVEDESPTRSSSKTSFEQLCEEAVVMLQLASTDPSARPSSRCNRQDIWHAKCASSGIGNVPYLKGCCDNGPEGLNQ